MGLETATYIGGLTPAWPLATDTKSQGDDHLRLLKSTLQATFPTATRAFYFPTIELVSALITLDATDQNNTIYVDTSGGSVTVNLPSGFGTSEKGWQCTVVKVSSDVANAAIVTPASGNIASKVGNTVTVRVGCLMEPAIFEWTGSAWICYKPGAVIGATYNFDGPTTPPGFLDLDGSVFSNTAFAELFAVLASTTLKDKRGRVEAGVDSTGRLSAPYFGATPNLGAVGGLEYHQLTGAQNGTHTHNTNDPGHFHVTGPSGVFGGSSAGDHTPGASPSPNGSVPLSNYNTDPKVTGITIQNNGSGDAHNNVQPTIIVKKIIRAC